MAWQRGTMDGAPVAIEELGDGLLGAALSGAHEGDLAEAAAAHQRTSSAVECRDMTHPRPLRDDMALTGGHGRPHGAPRPGRGCVSDTPHDPYERRAAKGPART